MSMLLRARIESQQHSHSLTTHLDAHPIRLESTRFAVINNDSSLSTMAAMCCCLQRRTRRHGGASSSPVHRLGRRHDVERFRALSDAAGGYLSQSPWKVKTARSEELGGAKTKTVDEKADEGKKEENKTIVTGASHVVTHRTTGPA